MEMTKAQRRDLASAKPVPGQSHWCEGLGDTCAQVVKNDSDHCEAGHENHVVSQIVHEPNTKLSALMLSGDVDDLGQADAMLLAPGKSVGMDEEVAFAKEHGIPISVLEPEGDAAVPSEDGTSKPLLSQATLNLIADAQELRRQYREVVDITYASTTSAYYSQAQLEVLRKKALDASILASGNQTRELLVDCLGPEFTVLRLEARAAGGAPFMGELDSSTKYALSPYSVVESFRVGGTGQTVLERGRLHGHSHKHWYVAKSCVEVHDENAPPLSFVAHVRLKDEENWYGKDRFSTVEERRKAFDADLGTANKVVALCPWHRYKATEGTPDLAEPPGCDPIGEAGSGLQ